MNYLVDVLVRIQPTNWIAIISLFISIAALIISNRRQSFDMKLVGAKKATEIRMIYLEYLRKIQKFRGAVEALEKICRECGLCPENSFTYYRESADSFQKLADMSLKLTDYPVIKETAILLEPITADGDDLCNRLSDITESMNKMAENCKTKKKSSEQSDAPDR
jgi:uncharacterized coiled-coil DUF342 family protein